MANSRLLNKNNNSIKYMQIGTIKYQKIQWTFLNWNVHFFFKMDDVEKISLVYNFISI